MFSGFINYDSDEEPDDRDEKPVEPEPKLPKQVRKKTNEASGLQEKTSDVKVTFKEEKAQIIWLIDVFKSKNAGHPGNKSVVRRNKSEIAQLQNILYSNDFISNFEEYKRSNPGCFVSYGQEKRVNPEPRVRPYKPPGNGYFGEGFFTQNSIYHNMHGVSEKTGSEFYDDELPDGDEIERV
jgi:hypothetical protein